MQQDVQIQSQQHLVQQQHQMAVAQLRHQQQVQKQPEQQQQLQQLIQHEAEVWIAKEQQKRAILPGSAGSLIYTDHIPPLQSHKVHTYYNDECSSRDFYLCIYM